MTNIQLVDGKGFIDLDKPENQAKLTPEQIVELVNKSNNVQSQVMAKLEALPHFERQVEALKQTPSFQELGEALTPLYLTTTPQPITQVTEKKQKKSIGESLGGILGFFPGGNTEEPKPAPQPIYNPLVCQHCGAKLKPNWTHCNNCGAPITPKTQYKIPTWIKPHHIHPLDAFAGAMTFIIWLAATGWIIQSFHLGYGTIIGLAVFWLFFIVAFRLMIGGLLD